MAAFTERKERNRFIIKHGRFAGKMEDKKEGEKEVDKTADDGQG